MTTITVHLFAGARETAGAESVEVSLGDLDRPTYGDLANALADARPALESLIAAARFAADSSYQSPDQPVDPSAEIALIPPVSGG